LELGGAAPSAKTAASDFRSCRQSHCDYDGSDDTAANMNSSSSDPLLASTLTTTTAASAAAASASGSKKRVSYGDSSGNKQHGKDGYQGSGMADVDETDEAGERSEDDDFESDTDATASTVSHNSSSSLRGASSTSQTPLQQAAAAAVAAANATSTTSVSTLPAIDTIRLSSPTVATVAAAQRRRSSCVQRPVGGTRLGGEQLAKLVNEAADGDSMVEKYTRYRRSFCAAPTASASSSGGSTVPLLQLLRAESLAEPKAAELDAADSSDGAAHEATALVV
jgi:hypothetical protein